MRYLDKLLAAQEANCSWLCIGLDPQPEFMPVEAVKWDEPVLPFNRRIIEATADLVCAYKPNLGFYLQWGAAGVIALERTIAYIPDHIPVIRDAKIGDIGHTQEPGGPGQCEISTPLMTSTPKQVRMISMREKRRESRRYSQGARIRPMAFMAKNRL